MVQKQIIQTVLSVDNIDNITIKRKMLSNFWTQYSNHTFLQRCSLKLKNIYLKFFPEEYQPLFRRSVGGGGISV